MRRRRFLATVGTVSSAGCLGGDVQHLGGDDDSDDDGDGDSDTDDVPGGSCLDGTPTMVQTTADAVHISFRDPGGEDEAIVLANESGGVLVLGDYRLEYDSGARFTFDSLALLPGASVTVESRGTDDATLKPCPPKYVRAAGFGKAVLGDGAPTVRLVTDEGDEVVRYSLSGDD